jgi:hypothetical protein
MQSPIPFLRNYENEELFLKIKFLDGRLTLDLSEGSNTQNFDTVSREFSNYKFLQFAAWCDDAPFTLETQIEIRTPIEFIDF